MPINPNIALQVRPPEMPNPVQNAAQLLSLKNMAQQSKLGGIQVEQAQEQQADYKALNDAIKLNTKTDESGQPTIDDDGVMQTLAQNGRGRMLMNFRAQLASLESDRIDAAKKKLELHSTQAKRKAQIASSMTDDASYFAGVKQALQEGLFGNDPATVTQAIAKLPKTYEEAKPTIQQWITSNMEGSQVTDYFAKIADEEQKKKIRPLQEREQKAKTETAESEATLKAEEARQATGLKPGAFFDQIDQVIDPKQYADINKRTKVQVAAYEGRRDWKAAKEALDKGRNEVGQIETAKINAQNRVVVNTGAAGTGDLSTDPMSQSILAQTGLSFPAFQVLTGQSGSLPRDAATRRAAMREAGEWANKRGVDISTFASRYRAINKTVEANIVRNNQAEVAEAELDATLQNLAKAADEGSFKSMRWANVVKMFAGQEFNDAAVNKYRFHLEQLRREFAMYNAAVEGQIDANGNIREINDVDLRKAETVIRDGFAKGSLAGFADALKASRAKMGVVLGQSVENQNKRVWDLFGVGQNYRGKGGEQQKAGNEDLSKVSTEELLRRLAGK